MRVDADQPQLARHLHAIARILAEHDGFVAEDFTVRERGGEFSCAIGEQFGVAGRVLVSYPPRLTVPMWQVTWSDDPDVMEPVAGLDSLAGPQRALLDAWLPLVNDTGKLRQIRRVVPRHAVTSWPLRHHLADGGYPPMRRPAAEIDPKETLLAWHSTGMRGGDATDAGEPPTPRWRLIPLKHLLNHDPAGAPQTAVPGRTSVVTSASSSDVATFENYGDLDAMQLLMSFGYVAPNAPLVHSVPTTVEAPGFGRVQVQWRAPRYRDESRPAIAADMPAITPTDDGFALHHLTIRPSNRPAVARLLAMALQARGGIPLDAAGRAAEHLLDLVCEANLGYFRRLDELVAGHLRALPLAGAPGAATPDASDAAVPPSEASDATVLAMLAQVSLSQQQALRDFWS